MATAMESNGDNPNCKLAVGIHKGSERLASRIHSRQCSIDLHAANDSETHDAEHQSACSLAFCVRNNVNSFYVPKS